MWYYVLTKKLSDEYGEGWYLVDDAGLQRWQEDGSLSEGDIVIEVNNRFVASKKMVLLAKGIRS